MIVYTLIQVGSLVFLLGVDPMAAVVVGYVGGTAHRRVLACCSVSTSAPDPGRRSRRESRSRSRRGDAGGAGAV
jgi:hypothetical protein